ncbi:MAG TPA: MFS transporter [Stellaceae bacterium]|nr:MFS transporter [Stellaceae bacterium]
MDVEGAEAPRAGFANAVRVLRIRNYGVYTAGNSISLIGTWMQRASVLWLAWALAHSTVWLGFVSVADLLPTLLLSPIAGLLADRVDRVRLIRWTQVIAMAQAVLLAALTYSGVITVELLFLLTLVLGAANAVNQPARLALIPNLVDRANLAAAVAVNALVFNLARFLGPAVAGIVIDRGSVGLAFALNAATYLPFIVALARIRLIPDAAPPASGARHELIGDTLAGYVYALRHPGIGRMILLFAVTTFSLRGFIEMFPGFADVVFGRGPVGYTWLTATLGLGAVMGGLWMVRRPGIHGLTALIIGHTCLIALSALGFTATASYWVAIACVFVCGFSLVTTGISAQTLIQSAVDPAMRGRVLGLYGLLVRAGPAFNALVLGWLASLIGLRFSVAAGALVCLAYWAWARLKQGAMERALEVEARGAAAR